MAIEPKTPRKRAIMSKPKTSKKKAGVPGEVETADVAVVTNAGFTEPAEPAAPKTRKKAAVPVPLFQAPTPEKAPAKARKATAKPASTKTTGEVVEKEAPVSESNDSDSNDSPTSDSESRSSRNRRRRRGGRGRRKPNGAEGADDAENTNDSEDSADDSEETTDADGTTHRRRRRRRATGEGVTPGETIDEDGVVTVVKVREAREKTERPTRERSTRDRNSRNSRERGGRDRNDSYREPYRRRGTILTDADFLARRENVDREMVVRQIGDRIQIAVIEDNVMVEHYVNRNANVSYVGNVYLGRVQNVLPSMEAAFVDIGKGRNAVLYAGEVNWDAAGISESEPRKIEMVLKTGQPVLVQVTKDPIGQKGARLTSQISLPGRYVVFVPGGGMSGISKRLPESERTRLKSILKMSSA
jgi:hypothetical protein